MEKFKNAAIRAARTFAQTFLGVYLAAVAGNEVGGLDGYIDLGAAEAAFGAALVAFVSFVQNALEDLNGGTPIPKG